MKLGNLWVSLSILSVTACQPQTAVEIPAVSEIAFAPVSATPAANSASTTNKEKVTLPAPESKPAAEQKTPPAPKAEKPALLPVAAEAGVAIPVAPAEVKSPEKPVPGLSEAEALTLAGKNGCLACHAIDKKVFGPAWREVATKYRRDAGAEVRLAEKIAKGGAGVWGNRPMPANPKISETERRSLARFVLSLE